MDKYLPIFINSTGDKMHVLKEEIDSLIFGKNVLKLDEIDLSVDFQKFEKDYKEEYDPKYVYTKLPVTDIDKIHFLENNGFEFIECQLQLFKRLTHLYDTSIYEKDMLLKLEEVDSENDLEEIQQISDITFDVDRIYIDSKLDKELAKKRYHLYIRNSLLEKNQRLDKLVDINNDRIIGFHTLMYKNNDAVLVLLGAVSPDYQKTGANNVLDRYLYNELFRLGRKNITTHISARNIKVLNYVQKILEFKIRQTFIVLRKIY